MAFPYDIDVMRIHNILIYCKSFHAYTDELQKDFDDIASLDIDVVSVVLSNKDVFWTEQVRHNRWRVRPKVNTQFCWQYFRKTCDGECGKLHLCKQYVNSSCCRPCPYGLSHELDSKHNSVVVKYIFPIRCGHQMKLKLLCSSFPKLCGFFKETGTCPKIFCGYLHVCADWVNGRCPPGRCIRAERSGVRKEVLHDFRQKHNFRVLQVFNLTIDYCEENILANILMWKVQHSNSEEQCISNDAENFKWLVKEAVCYKYIEGDCESCNLYHIDSGLPYAWQYYDNSMWNMFDRWFNQEVEKAFCDPQNDGFDSRSIDSNKCDALQILDLHSRHQWNWAVFKSNVVNIRRLSTKSSVLVHDTEAVAMTEWKWYWKNGDKWQEYTNGTTSYSIEKAYVANCEGTFDFITNEFKYEINFASMQQQNLDERYKTVRDVRRRPTYKTKKTMSRVTQVITVKHALPLHWPITSNNFNAKGGRIAVDTLTRLKIENSFIASMKHSVKIVAVEELCNAEFFESYQSKKLLLTSKVGSYNLNELSLYHGTDHSVVNGICAQNFDWRLCGKNATAYGQGSYFAKNASYSHRYSTADIEKFRYMFVANVLVGRYTQGDSSMKRPPPVNVSLDAYTLYDSCVNDCNNPTIFVIFERDQCYPQYLITYVNYDEVDATTNAAIRRKSSEMILQPLAVPQPHTEEDERPVTISAASVIRPSSTSTYSSSSRRWRKPRR